MSRHKTERRSRPDGDHSTGILTHIIFIYSRSVPGTCSGGKKNIIGVHFHNYVSTSILRLFALRGPKRGNEQAGLLCPSRSRCITHYAAQERRATRRRHDRQRGVLQLLQLPHGYVREVQRAELGAAWDGRQVRQQAPPVEGGWDGCLASRFRNPAQDCSR